MTLRATRPLMRGRERVGTGQKIPETWPLDDPFVADCLRRKWIADDNDDDNDGSDSGGETDSPSLETSVPNVRIVDAGGQAMRARVAP